MKKGSNQSRLSAGGVSLGCGAMI